MTQTRNYSDGYDVFRPVEDTEGFRLTRGGRMRRWSTDVVYDEPVAPRWL